MAHEIENMFFTGETPWHGLGKQVKPGLTSQEAIEAAGLSWCVNKVPLVTTEAEARAVDHKAIVRSDTNAILGIVGPRFEPLQNSEAFKFFDPFVQAGEATYSTAGSLQDGKRIWVLAELNRKPIEVVKGDEVKKFLLLSNSHDGTLAVRVGFTPIRVVCANTLKIAHSDNGSALIRVRHTAKTQATLDEIRGIMNLADARFEATAEQYRALAAKSCNLQDLEAYVKIVFGNRESKQFETIKAKVVQLFESGKGSELSRGTVWGAYNAVTEYLGYEAGRNQDNRLNSLWYGPNDTINQIAFDEALKLAA